MKSRAFFLRGESEGAFPSHLSMARGMLELSFEEEEAEDGDR
jgi:hypothetical protein